jgi:outer membrane protein OmpA-like peptidoglycan-associated protein
LEPGQTTWVWNLKDDNGQMVSPGAYWISAVWNRGNALPVAQAPAQVTVKAAHSRIDLRVVAARFAFDDSIAGSDEEIRRYLMRENSLFHGVGSASLIVGGFTDSLGTTQRNQQLSEQRARWVASKLSALRKSLSQTEPGKTDVIGLGLGTPPKEWPNLAIPGPNDPASRQERARRAEIWLRISY